MNNVDTQSLMLQMRSLAAQAQAKPLDPVQGVLEAGKGTEKSEDFAHLLSNSIEEVNKQQHYSKEMKESFERGDPGVELSEVMLQAQKASLSFQAMTQVRNKLVEAYKEVTQMPI